MATKEEMLDIIYEFCIDEEERLNEVLWESGLDDFFLWKMGCLYTYN